MKTGTKSELYRKLPGVDEVAGLAGVKALAEREGKAAVTEAVRAVLGRLRQEIASGRLDGQRLELALGGLGEAVERELRKSFEFSLRPVINATGVVLHTNLGRAPLAPEALTRMREIASQYSNLEFDVAAGERGQRDSHVDRLFGRLLNQGGMSDVATVVVNNNAAAVLLTLNTLAEGGEVVVSRGELVEIGGSFRIPEVMTKSGAALREVGTTNRTRLADYERAMGEKTKLVLRVHRSNFQIVGFTEQPALEELVKLAHKHKVPLVEDLGSGALVDLASLGMAREPSVYDSLRAGVDVVTYSGDKLLGGPQAGMVSGRAEMVARIRGNPLFRALRVDKLTYAALETTVMAYLRQDHNAIPALRMLRQPAKEIGKRAARMAERVGGGGLRVEVVEGESVVGGGAAPGATLPTMLLTVSAAGMSAEEMASRLRANQPPVIARVEEGRVLLDLRTVFPEQDEQVAEALRAMQE